MFISRIILVGLLISTTGYVYTAGNKYLTPNKKTLLIDNGLETPWTKSITNQIFLKIECDSIFNSGEKTPRFKGGDIALLTYNLNKIFPIIGAANKESGNLISKLRYTLTISKEGRVVNATIVTDVDEKLKINLEKELLQMPHWIPGEVNGKTVCMNITYPIACIKWE